MHQPVDQGRCQGVVHIGEFVEGDQDAADPIADQSLPTRLASESPVPLAESKCG
jgi:hypothetical protein